MSNDRYEQARQRVGQLKSFYGHLLVFVLLNIGLFVIDALQGGGWWFYWATFGWGIGLLTHGLSVFALPGMFGKNWEERKIREYMDQDK